MLTASLYTLVPAITAVIVAVGAVALAYRFASCFARRTHGIECHF